MPLIAFIKAFHYYLFLINIMGKRLHIVRKTMIILHYFGNKVIEEPPFSIHRPEGSFRYIFFHFISPVVIYTSNGSFDAPPGSCILYRPGTIQKFEVIKNRLNHDYLDFVVEDDQFFETIKFPLDDVFNPFMSDEIRKLYKKIIEEKQLGRPDSKYLISCYLTEFFIDVARKLNKTKRYKKESGILSEKFEDIRLSLYQNPKENYVKDMADSFFYSLPYFSYLYKKHFKVTPMEDLNNARIAYINNNRDNFKSVNLLCEDLGFSSAEYFYRWFKTYFNMTPKEFFNHHSDKS